MGRELRLGGSRGSPLMAEVLENAQFGQHALLQIVSFLLRCMLAVS